MEKGARTMAWMLIVAAVVGALVIALHPDYRELFRQIRAGKPAETAIWRSNEIFYPAVGPTEELTGAK